jgi:hypothetical protein
MFPTDADVTATPNFGFPFSFRDVAAVARGANSTAFGGAIQMSKFTIVLMCATALVTSAASGQESAAPIAARLPLAVSSTTAVLLPSDTVLSVIPLEEISSKHMTVGDVQRLQVSGDVSQNGIVIIPRGAAVKATVTWRTGKGIGGKSAKFVLTFNSVNVQGKEYLLKGTHRQEGRGNTVAALLGSMLISGHSAVMMSGQVVTALTAEPIPAA